MMKMEKTHILYLFYKQNHFSALRSVRWYLVMLKIDLLFDFKSQCKIIWGKWRRQHDVSNVWKTIVVLLGGIIPIKSHHKKVYWTIQAITSIEPSIQRKGNSLFLTAQFHLQHVVGFKSIYVYSAMKNFGYHYKMHFLYIFLAYSTQIQF